MDSAPNQQERSREIARLTRVCAQNRSLGVVVGLLIFTALSAAIGILSYVGGMAFRESNLVLYWACMVALVPVLAAVLFLSVPRWGGRWLEGLTRRFYHEGNVSISVPEQPLRQRIAWVVGGVFGCCVLATVLLGLLGYVPPMYSQPISALYVVPFLMVLNILMRPAVGYASLLWPLLYGLHAILIVAGAAIVFSGRWESLNIGLPVIGYGLLTALICHAYHRYAMHKLRRTARTHDVGPREIDGGFER